jgi:signal recognition particle subunit SRP54
MAQRIIGQGDLMSLIEKVKRVHADISEEEMRKQQEKLARGNFTLDDFRKQFSQLQKMGPLRDVLKDMPGGLGDMLPDDEDPEAGVKRIQGMIDSMTKQERQDPDVIDLSRRRRIAAGCGVEPHDVKQFLQQFDGIRDLMRKMMTMSVWERMKMVMGLGKAGAFDPGSKMLQKKGDTGHRKSPKERAKDRKKKKKR